MAANKQLFRLMDGRSFSMDDVGMKGLSVCVRRKSCVEDGVFWCARGFIGGETALYCFIFRFIWCMVFYVDGVEEVLTGDNFCFV